MSFRTHFGHDIYHIRMDKLKWTQQQIADAVFISLREYQIETEDRKRRDFTWL